MSQNMQQYFIQMLFNYTEYTAHIDIVIASSSCLIFAKLINTSPLNRTSI